MRLGGQGHGEDEGGAGLGADALVAVGGVGVEVDRVALLEAVFLAVVGELELAREHVEELRAGVLVEARGAGFARGQELGDVGRDLLAVGGEAGDLAEGFVEVAGVVDAGLGEAVAVFGADDAEELGLVGLEEIAEVAGEDHRDAGEVAQRGHDAAGLKLREEAGGEAGVAAKLDEAHLFALAEVLDARAKVLGFEEGLGGFGGNGFGRGFRFGGGVVAGGVVGAGLVAGGAFRQGRELAQEAAWGRRLGRGRLCCFCYHEINRC
jgi:hypothetical protein